MSVTGKNVELEITENADIRDMFTHIPEKSKGIMIERVKGDKNTYKRTYVQRSGFFAVDAQTGRRTRRT